MRNTYEKEASVLMMIRQIDLGQSAYTLSLLPVRSTIKRANSLAIWLSERQRMIKRARSEELGSLEFFDGI